MEKMIVKWVWGYWVKVSYEVKDFDKIWLRLNIHASSLT